jgi:Domain of unknown function (DUF2017)
VKRVKVTPDGLRLAFNEAEAGMLVSVAEQTAELLGGFEDRAGDPALERLLPDGYRDNSEDAEEFRRFTQTELVDEKVAAARLIVDSLSTQPDKGVVRVTLSSADAITWLRSLNDIRLAFAARLGIVDESFRPAYDDDNYAIYVWLGQVQFLLLHAVDR